MWDKRWCRGVWSLAFLLGSVFCLWRLSGCPGPPAGCSLLIPNFSPLLPANFSSAPPPYPLHLLSPQDPTTLINLTEFSFLSLPTPCNDTPLIVAAVHSAPLNFVNRQIIRSTWGTAIKVVFMLGESNSSKVASQLDLEMKEFGDVVQGSFLDTYRNLTYKHAMALKWTTYYCPGARYMLKTDDDVFVNTAALQKLIRKELSPLGARRLILCDIVEHALAQRTFRSKWRVSPSEYPNRYYPPYCTGWAILYSPDVVFKLYSEAQQTPYFWIDDVHITGTLASMINITQTHSKHLMRLPKQCQNMVDNESLVDRYGDVIFCLTKIKNIPKLWYLVDEASHLSATQT
uniref:Hexosyltransferase n=1 Tax=Lygus hesperus TaxID=30085 RepID=A0A0A9ZF59_LYGHE